MNKNKQSLTIRRILVALDTSPPSLAALEAAAKLALQFQAELVGLFIEDVNLLKVAQYPFAREIRYPGGTIQKLDAHSMEIQLRQTGARARAVLRRSAEQSRLQWTFRILRGAVPAELMAAAREADLLVLGRTSRRLVQSSRVGSTAETAVIQTARPVLLLCSNLDLSKPVMIYYDGSTAAQLALTIAAPLAQISGVLHVLLFAEDEPAEQKCRQEILAYQGDFKVIGLMTRLPNHEALDDVFAKSEFGLIVIGDTAGEPSKSIIQRLLREFDHPLLIIR